MITGFQISDVLADLLDDTGRFVAQNGGQGRGIQVLDEMQITVAKSGRRSTHQNLVVTNSELHSGVL